MVSEVVPVDQRLKDNSFEAKVTCEISDSKTKQCNRHVMCCLMNQANSHGTAIIVYLPVVLICFSLLFHVLLQTGRKVTKTKPRVAIVLAEAEETVIVSGAGAVSVADSTSITGTATVAVKEASAVLEVASAVGAVMIEVTVVNLEAGVVVVADFEAGVVVVADLAIGVAVGDLAIGMGVVDLAIGVVATVSRTIGAENAGVGSEILSEAAAAAVAFLTRVEADSTRVSMIANLLKTRKLRSMNKFR